MVFIILSVALYTAATMFGAGASRIINTNLAGAITTLVSIIIPLLIVIPRLDWKNLGNQKLGLGLAALGGVAIALFVLAINKSYSLNKVAVVVPVVFGGTIFLSTILSYFFFKEKIGLLQGLGLALLGVGLILIILAKLSSE